MDGWMDGVGGWVGRMGTERQLPRQQKRPMAMQTPSSVSLFTVEEAQNKMPAETSKRKVQSLRRVAVVVGGWVGG